jgi:hypothetical protein
MYFHGGEFPKFTQKGCPISGSEGHSSDKHQQMV